LKLAARLEDLIAFRGFAGFRFDIQQTVADFNVNRIGM
jgi:hypothetical protein